MGVVGGANPHNARCGGLAFIMLSAVCTYDKPCKRISYGAWLFARVVFRPSCKFLLHRLKAGKINNSFVRSHRVVLRLFTVILHLTLGEMIFAVGLLQYEVARVYAVPVVRSNLMTAMA